MRLAVTVVAVVTACAVASAAGFAQETPKDVAGAFFKALVEERWRDAARAMDLLAFDRYRRERVAAERLPRPPMRHITVDEYMQREPDMPRVVAEYHVRKFRERRYDPNEWLVHEYADVPTIDSLAALPVEEAAARWLRAQDLRWAIRQARERERAQGCPLPTEGADLYPAPAYRVLGEVMVDSTTAYVLHEDRQFQRPEPDVDAAMHAMPPNILTLRRRRDGWKILPREAMLRGPGGVGFVSVQCSPTNRPRPPR